MAPLYQSMLLINPIVFVCYILCVFFCFVCVLWCDPVFLFSNGIIIIIIIIYSLMYIHMVESVVFMTNISQYNFCHEELL